MDKKNLKVGDVITVQTETVGKTYETTGDIQLVEISNPNTISGPEDVGKIFGKNVYKIEEVDTHEDLATFGVNIGHFVLRGTKVSTLADKGTSVRVNGDFDIPYESEEDEIAPVLETYILDVVIAESIARALNHVNRKKFKTLREAVEKAEVMMDQIDKKGYV